MKGKLKIKYHQAAYVYLVNAVIFIITFNIQSHDFGIWDSLLNTIGIAMMGLFALLIYRGYRGFTMMLAGICAIRTGVTIFNVPFFTETIVYMLLLQGFTCFMMLRAVLD